MEEMHDLTKAIIQTVVADICKEFLINFLYMIEEMAELTQAICKDKRSRGQGQEIGGTWLYSNIKKNLIEELADVKLVLSQVIYLLDCED